MNIYFVNRYSKLKGPFDIIGSNRQHIIKIGDICLHDTTKGVEFLFVYNSNNIWNSCKFVGIGKCEILSEIGNTLLFSFDGLSRRKGNTPQLKQLALCYREKVIVDFFRNAVDILEYRKDFWDVSLFRQFFASSQELITPNEIISPSIIPDSRKYPSAFAKYLDNELIELLQSSINEGIGLKEAYVILREKNPVLFRSALVKFIEDNPNRTIYDKYSIPSSDEAEKEYI
jgi:hypothetical protein